MFADRMSRVKGSIIREILKFMSDPEIISFGGGSPANESFPIETMDEIIHESIAAHGAKIFQYGITEGWLPLREAYTEHIVRPRGVEASLENVIITTGSTQGIMLASEVFLNENDVVFVESPTFLSALMVFNKLNCRCVPIETDEQGIIIQDLEEKIKLHNPKMLYCVPTFQNPTGKTLPADRRKAVAKLASENNFIVLEDDPYCDLRYFGEFLSPIKSYDSTGNVILLNSFSKNIAPGLRVGAVVAEPEIIKKMTVAKQFADTHTTILTQEICAQFLNRGLLPDHLLKINGLYKERMLTMLSCIDKYFPAGIKYTRADGGLFTWVQLPKGINANHLLEYCTKEHKVAFIPGSPFFINPDEGNGFIRMNFSSNTPERIQEGMKKLGDAICKFTGE